MSTTIPPKATSNRQVFQLLSKAGGVLAIAIAAALLVVFAVQAVRWQQQPYPGFLVNPDTTVANPYSFMQGVTPATLAGLQVGDRVLSVAREPLESGAVAAQLRSTLADQAMGEPVAIWFDRAGGQETPEGADCVTIEGSLQECVAILTLEQYPLVDFLLQFGMSWLTGVAGLVGAVLLLRARWNSADMRLVVIFVALLAIFAGGVFDLHTSRIVSPLVYPFVLAMLGGMLLLFAINYPTQLPLVRRVPAVQFVPPLVTLVAIAIAALQLNAGADNLQSALVISVVFLATTWVLLLVALIWRIRQAVSPSVRDQCALVMTAMLLSLAPGLVWLFSTSVDLNLLGQSLGFHFSLVTPFLFFLPAAMVYGLLQGVLPQGDQVISQGIVYSLMALIITIGYGLLVTGVTLLTGSVVQLSNPLVVAVTVFLVALGFVPVRNALERRVNDSYFRSHRLYQNRIEILAQDLSEVGGLGGVVDALRRALGETLNPTHTFLFFPDDLADHYLAYGVPNPETDIRFEIASPLVQLLFRRQRALHLGMGAPLPPELSSERARLAVLGTPVVLPLRGRDRLSGFMAVGPRQSAERYDYEDLAFMQALANQAALAVERAQVIANLEQRVREMNVLGQVAQAVNYTVEFDDLLELIFAQTNRVIDAPNFYIALRDPNAEELYYAFYSQEDERLPDREHVRWRVGRDVISEIVRTGQPLRVENYGLELDRRSVESPLENRALKAWMGVPLSAPGSALGVLCVGSTGLGTIYNDEQLKILWQIADQAAVAIDKARLFRETEIRARQLTTLNEISTQLATVFQDNERLLQLITESAVEILEAEAGSLLMIQPETQELEFKVATGSQGRTLVGRRLPGGTGLVGTVADRGEPVIVNDTTRDPRWYSGLDDDGKFHTSTLIAAPLNGNTGVIGVLEVLNKRDGGVFVDDDKRLLVAFAGQAAIAIENARLFQMTDQQLAARVEELDTMQKIDRELNETLKLQRVLNITLDWALRESGASAGAMGMVLEDPPALRIMAHYGYPEDAFAETDHWSLERGVVGRVVRTKQPELVSDVLVDTDYVETLPEGRCQLTVPLFTGGEVSGVIILESVEPNAFTLLDLDFISRLAEHASPAMANAILLAELERANSSRSEFVGFVAHELKTPMTSIKGFADLLLGGVVGPLNDQQKGFLGTIRSNVERMTTLVSDLNDVTKLQTDRMLMQKASIDFNNVVLETLRPLKTQIEEKGQTVNLDMRSRLPMIYADQNRLIQVLTNLVTNAYKYTPPDGDFTISAVPSSNNWDSTGPSEVLHVSVKDNGIGISEEDQARLFEAYFRTTNPEALEQPGTGLGLVIVRGIVEQHGGRIWVESTLGEGSTFHLTIPLASAVPEAVAQASA